jgi:ethanolamine permease
MYLTSLASLFRLRQTEPHLERPFKTPFYPWVPLLSLGLAVLCLVAIVYFNLTLSLLFLGLLSVTLVLFLWTRKHQ